MPFTAGWKPRQYEKQKQFLANLISEKARCEHQTEEPASGERIRLQIMSLTQKIASVGELIAEYEATQRAAATNSPATK